MKKRNLTFLLLGVAALFCVQQVHPWRPPWRSSQPPPLLLEQGTQRRQLDQGTPQIVNITTPAAIHGWVKKAGPVNPLHWHDDYSQARRDQFNEWHITRLNSQQRRVQLEQAGEATDWLPDPPPGIIPACQVFVNHRYKFIYVRHTKTGSMSLVRFLTLCMSSNPGPACLDPLPSNTTHEELERLFSEYFVFTVVRNPLKRALSSYKFLITRMHAEPPSCTQGLGWDAFCGDPMALGQRCRDSPQCCVRSAGLFWAHTFEQGRCLLTTGSGGWAVDYIGRTEHLDEDVVEILQEIDRRQEPGTPALSGGVLESDGPKHLNLAPSCAVGGARLEPFKRLVGAGGGTYLAAISQEQYCNEFEYFSGRHSSCLPALQHFFQRDLHLFYGKHSWGPTDELATGEAA